MISVKSYNQNTIYKITQQININGFKRSVDIYYDAGNRTVLRLGDRKLATLTPDAFNISCATIGDCGACHPNSLLSNLGFCLLTNDGDFILHNGG